MRRIVFYVIVLAFLLPFVADAGGLNVVLKSAITDGKLARLAQYGKIRDTVYEINAVTMQAQKSQIPLIRALPFVAAVNADQVRDGKPIDTVPFANFADGFSTYDNDAINVTISPLSGSRNVTQDGTGVYVAVLDTGLVDTWRQYFPQERIAVEHARSFGGGGGEAGNVSTQPNKWGHDTNSHGTHVTSTILGYSFFGDKINGVAPKSTVIPVKVLNQNGSGWSSVIARGIVYIGNLKAGVLSGSPVVINMSLGGPVLDAVEKAAIDFAISQGVIIVASAGNRGNAGMGFPGAYAPVISSAASGWVGQWTTSPCGGNFWWLCNDVAEPTSANDFYIADFSSRELAGQDLDIAAPGYWTVGPYQLNQGQISYFFLAGTSMASPHVAGTVALMLQKNPTLTAAQAETILQNTAIPLPAGNRTVNLPPTGSGLTQNFSWGSNATGAGLLDAAAAIAATP